MTLDEYLRQIPPTANAEGTVVCDEEGVHVTLKMDAPPCFGQHALDGFEKARHWSRSDPFTPRGQKRHVMVWVWNREEAG